MNDEVFVNNLTIDPPIPFDLVDRANMFLQMRHDYPEAISIHCDWRISERGGKVVWTGSEKSRFLDKWLQFIIDEYISSVGSKVEGYFVTIDRDYNERNTYSVVDNKVKENKG